MLTQNQLIHNRYQIIRLVGQGGFGAVYEARDTTLNITVALKENFEDKLSAQRQFNHEATILAGLRHANLPRVTDYFTLPGQGQYLVMDYVAGIDLKSMLADKGAPLDVQQTVSWIIQICDALTYLHNQKPPIIHRDLKPENIIITPNNQAMLVDFGVAKVYDPSLKTTVGARAVTPGFSPPEQYGHGSTDARTDIYSLGATLYTLLTNQEPIESVQRTMRVNLQSARSLNSTIPYSLDHAIQKAMEVVPADRYQQMEHFKAALTQQQYIAPAVKPPGLPASLRMPSTPVSKKPVDRKQVVSTSMTVGLVLIGLLILFGLMRLVSKPPATATAAPSEMPNLAEEGLTSTVEVLPAVVGSTPPASQPVMTPVPTNTLAVLATSTSEMISASKTPLPTNANTCVRLVFIRDVTIPDGSVFPPGSEFVKTWRLQNIGSCALDEGAAMVYLGGTEMTDSERVKIQAVAQPGQTFDVSLPMRAPAAAGQYQSQWAVETAQKALITSLQLSVVIEVK